MPKPGPPQPSPDRHGGGDQARAALEADRQTESAATTARRRAEETERTAARDLESVAREAAWHDAQAERLAGEVARHREAVAAGEAASNDRVAETTGHGDAPDGAALAMWESRAAELRATRDRLAAELGVIDAARREAENLRARTEAGIAMGEERATRAARELDALDEREAGLRQERDRVRADLAAATDAESTARAAIRDLQSADLEDRDRLGAAERAASAARERLRAADERSRAAERSELETRLGADALREQVLVELAGIGDVGIRGLAAVAGLDPDGLTESSDEVTSEETAALQAALDVAHRRVGRGTAGRAAARAGPAGSAPPTVPRTGCRRSQRARGPRRAERATRRRSMRRARTCGPRSRRPASSSPSWTRSSPTSSGRRSPRWRRRSRPASSSCSAAGTRSCH